jgi:hypothetical protein
MFRRTKSENKVCERRELIFIHVTIETTNGIEFGAAMRCATITDGRGSGACGEGFREEDTSLMKVEVLVGNVASQIANYLGYDRMSRCTPFVCGGGENI